MIRHNHYEAAFEDYLRSEMIPYIAVNEKRRAIAAQGSLKNLDFILSPDVRFEREDPFERFESDEPFNNPSQRQWLVDVKGRRFPSGSQYWRNWTTEDELNSLTRWQKRFGDDFEAALIFVYQLTSNQSPVPVNEIHFYRSEAYAMVAVTLDDYRQQAKPLSAKWQTVSVPTARFRQLARPLVSLFSERLPA